jgi:hypothetical protein
MKQISLTQTLLLGALTLSACGPQPFVPATMVSDQTAAGTLNLPKRVDIMVSVSTDGGIANILTDAQTELDKFTSGLQKSGWDYRMFVVPMAESDTASLTNTNIPVLYDQRVAVSKYDYNQMSWNGGAGYQAPYPGAVPNDPFYTLLPSLATPYLSITAQSPIILNGRQTGLLNQKQFLSLPYVQQNILRTDANLAVITISNGKDTSDGWTTDNSSPNPVTLPNPVNIGNYLPAMQAVKAPGKFKYYALASEFHHISNTCRNGPARTGTAYKQIAEASGGLFIDLCYNSINQALTSISNSIQSQQMFFKKEYLVLETQPDPSTIKVYKNGVLLPQGGSNGWTYNGMQTQYLIYDPAPMELRTGYMIQLFGTARLQGTDSARVEYLNYGVQASH